MTVNAHSGNGSYRSAVSLYRMVQQPSSGDLKSPVNSDVSLQVY